MRLCAVNLAVNTGGNATQQMEESYKNNTTSVQMLLTLASPDLYGYPGYPAPQQAPAQWRKKQIWKAIVK